MEVSLEGGQVSDTAPGKSKGLDSGRRPLLGSGHSRIPRPKETSMKRRTFLRIGSAAMAGGIEGIVRARRAPAFAQPVKIHLLHWPDFIPEGDVELRRQIAEYNKQMKTEVFMENINGNDLQQIGRASCRERV